MQRRIWFEYSHMHEGRVSGGRHLGVGCWWGLAAHIPGLRLGTPGTMVAGVALAVGGWLLIIAARWDSRGEGSQRCRVTG
jgi:hypothetical protein